MVEIKDTIIVEYNKIEEGRYLRVLKCEHYENVNIANPLNLVCLRAKNKKELQKDFERIEKLIGGTIMRCSAF